MSRLVPDDPDVDGWYWLQSAGTIHLAEWLAHRRWVICGLVYSPESAAERGHTFARVGDAECRHPIPSPAALLRMHAPDTEMICAGDIEIVADSTTEAIFAAMLKEAMKG